MIALVVYVVSFSVGFGPIPWLMMGEVFPARIRGAAASLATAFNWACTFIVTKTFMDLQVHSFPPVKLVRHTLAQSKFLVDMT